MDEIEWMLLKADLLEDFDRQWTLDLLPCWDNYLQRCPDSSARIELLGELIRGDLAFRRWPVDDVDNRLRLLSEQGAGRADLIQLLHGVFVDRVNGKERPAWSEFQGLGFSEDDLCLRCDGEVLYLGLVVGTRWRLDQRVGDGAYGIVYRARDLTTDTDVAIKEFRDAAAARTGNTTSLVEEELFLLSQLRHPNICRFVEGVTDPNGHVLAFVYQYVEGQTLRRLLRQGQLTPADAARIVVGLADALDYVHQAGLLHCDVKPENVLIDKGWVPYLTDFGFASSAAILFDLSTVGGTPGYIAPEAILGPGSQIDGRSDIWSLGAILFELLTGTRVDDPPVSANDPEQEEWPAFPIFVEESIRDICRRCLAQRPNDRYDAAGFLARDLRIFLGEAVPPELYHVPIFKLSLDAWRAGFLLGTAFDEHEVAQEYLSEVKQSRQKGTLRRSAVVTKMSQHERTAFEALAECFRLVDRMGLSVPAADEIQDTALFLPDAAVERGHVEELEQFAVRFGRLLRDAYEQVRDELARQRQDASAIFNLAVNSAVCKAVGHSTRLRQLARSTGLGHDCYAEFVTIIRKKPPSEVLGRERDRMGKRVERYLVNGMSDRGIPG